MSDIKMPDPVAHAITAANTGLWVKVVLAIDAEYEGIDRMRREHVHDLITTDQAEAYAQECVREALEEAYQSAREVEEKLLADHMQHVSGPAAANYVANRIRALLPSTPAQLAAKQ